jgi:hypothetical protein
MACGNLRDMTEPPRPAENPTEDVLAAIQEVIDAPRLPFPDRGLRRPAELGGKRLLAEEQTRVSANPSVPAQECRRVVASIKSSFVRDAGREYATLLLIGGCGAAFRLQLFLLDLVLSCSGLRIDTARARRFVRFRWADLSNFWRPRWRAGRAGFMNW